MKNINLALALVIFKKKKTKSCLVLVFFFSLLCFLNCYILILQARWDEVHGMTTQRGSKLRGALDEIRANAMLLDQLIGWLTAAEANLSAQSHEILPDNLPIIEQLLHDHQVRL